MSFSVYLSVLAALVLAACNRADKNDSGAAPSVQLAPGPRASASPPPLKARAAEAPVTEAQAQALLDRWLEAQNRGDFAAYEKLYASRFTGIKRVGKGMRKMDRKAWLLDRKGMFRYPTRVQAADVKVAPGLRTARLAFVQTWASPSYKDEGPKEIVAVREGGDLRISREELLSSRAPARQGSPTGQSARRAATANETGNASLRIVLKLEGKDYLVVGEGAPISRPRFANDKANIYTVIGTTNTDEEPDIAKWVGARIRLITDRGKTCEVVGGKLSAVARAVPHFGEVQAWRDAGMSEAEQAEAVTQHGIPLYALELTGVSSAGCVGEPVLGQPASVQEPVLFERIEDGALEHAALTAFRGLPEYSAVQEDYARTLREAPDSIELPSGQAAAPAKWEDLGQFTQVAVFRSAQRGQTIAWVRAEAGVGCGHWLGQVQMTFDVRSKGKSPTFVPLPDARLSATYDGVEDLLLVLDSDHDGQLDYLGVVLFGLERELSTSDPNHAVRLSANFHDCPC